LYNKLTVNGLGSFKIEYAAQVFNSFGICTKSGHFRTYMFPDNFANADVGHVKCFSQDDPKIVAFGFGGFAEKVYAIEQEGIIFSACISSRQNSKSAEAWVFTHPDHRRKGLAQQVVTAWAGNLQREGIIPFYSHDVENSNSAILARKLKLVHLFDENVIEKAA
jgi:GNAT superfamily N-acetyltransferase